MSSFLSKSSPEHSILRSPLGTNLINEKKGIKKSNEEDEIQKSLSKTLSTLVMLSSDLIWTTETHFTVAFQPSPQKGGSILGTTSTRVHGWSANSPIGPSPKTSPGDGVSSPKHSPFFRNAVAMNKNVGGYPQLQCAIGLSATGANGKILHYSVEKPFLLVGNVNSGADRLFCLEQTKQKGYKTGVRIKPFPIRDNPQADPRTWSLLYNNLTWSTLSSIGAPSHLKLSAESGYPSNALMEFFGCLVGRGYYPNPVPGVNSMNNSMNNSSHNGVLKTALSNRYQAIGQLLLQKLQIIGVGEQRSGGKLAPFSNLQDSQLEIDSALRSLIMSSSTEILRILHDWLGEFQQNILMGLNLCTVLLGMGGGINNIGVEDNTAITGLNLSSAIPSSALNTLLSLLEKHNMTRKHMNILDPLSRELLVSILSLSIPLNTPTSKQLNLSSSQHYRDTKNRETNLSQNSTVITKLILQTIQKVSMDNSVFKFLGGLFLDYGIQFSGSQSKRDLNSEVRRFARHILGSKEAQKHLVKLNSGIEDFVNQKLDGDGSESVESLNHSSKIKQEGKDPKNAATSIVSGGKEFLPLSDERKIPLRSREDPISIIFMRERFLLAKVVLRKFRLWRLITKDILQDTYGLITDDSLGSFVQISYSNGAKSTASTLANQEALATAKAAISSSTSTPPPLYLSNLKQWLGVGILSAVLDRWERAFLHQEKKEEEKSFQKKAKCIVKNLVAYFRCSEGQELFEEHFENIDSLCLIPDSGDTGRDAHLVNGRLEEINDFSFMMEQEDQWGSILKPNKCVSFLQENSQQKTDTPSNIDATITAFNSVDDLSSIQSSVINQSWRNTVDQTRKVDTVEETRCHVRFEDDNLNLDGGWCLEYMVKPVFDKSNAVGNDVGTNVGIVGAMGDFLTPLGRVSLTKENIISQGGTRSDDELALGKNGDLIADSLLPKVPEIRPELVMKHHFSCSLLKVGGEVSQGSVKDMITEGKSHEGKSTAFSTAFQIVYHSGTFFLRDFWTIQGGMNERAFVIASSKDKISKDQPDAGKRTPSKEKLGLFSPKNLNATRSGPSPKNASNTPKSSMASPAFASPGAQVVDSSSLSEQVFLKPDSWNHIAICYTVGTESLISTPKNETGAVLTLILNGETELVLKLERGERIEQKLIPKNLKEEEKSRHVLWKIGSKHLKITEIRIWDRARTKDELREFLKCPLPQTGASERIEKKKFKVRIKEAVGLGLDSNHGGLSLDNLVFDGLLADHAFSKGRARGRKQEKNVLKTPSVPEPSQRSPTEVKSPPEVKSPTEDSVIQPIDVYPPLDVFAGFQDAFGGFPEWGESAPGGDTTNLSGVTLDEKGQDASQQVDGLDGDVVQQDSADVNGIEPILPKNIVDDEKPKNIVDLLAQGPCEDEDMGEYLGDSPQHSSDSVEYLYISPSRKIPFQSDKKAKLQAVFFKLMQGNFDSARAILSHLVLHHDSKHSEMEVKFCWQLKMNCFRLIRLKQYFEQVKMDLKSSVEKLEEHQAVVRQMNPRLIRSVCKKGVPQNKPHADAKLNSLESEQSRREAHIWRKCMENMEMFGLNEDAKLNSSRRAELDCSVNETEREVSPKMAFEKMETYQDYITEGRNLTNQFTEGVNLMNEMEKRLQMQIGYHSKLVMDVAIMLLYITSRIVVPHQIDLYYFLMDFFLDTTDGDHPLARMIGIRLLELLHQIPESVLQLKTKKGTKSLLKRGITPNKRRGSKVRFIMDSHSSGTCEDNSEDYSKYSSSPGGDPAYSGSPPCGDPGSLSPGPNSQARSLGESFVEEQFSMHGSSMHGSWGIGTIGVGTTGALGISVGGQLQDDRPSTNAQNHEPEAQQEEQQRQSTESFKLSEIAPVVDYRPDGNIIGDDQLSSDDSCIVEIKSGLKSGNSGYDPISSNRVGNGSQLSHVSNLNGFLDPSSSAYAINRNVQNMNSVAQSRMRMNLEGRHWMQSPPGNSHVELHQPEKNSTLISSSGETQTDSASPDQRIAGPLEATLASEIIMGNDPTTTHDPEQQVRPTNMVVNQNNTVVNQTGEPPPLNSNATASNFASIGSSNTTRSNFVSINSVNSNVALFNSTTGVASSSNPNNRNIATTIVDSATAMVTYPPNLEINVISDSSKDSVAESLQSPMSIPFTPGSVPGRKKKSRFPNFPKEQAGESLVGDNLTSFNTSVNKKRSIGSGNALLAEAVGGTGTLNGGVGGGTTQLSAGGLLNPLQAAALMSPGMLSVTSGLMSPTSGLMSPTSPRTGGLLSPSGLMSPNATTRSALFFPKITKEHVKEKLRICLNFQKSSPIKYSNYKCGICKGPFPVKELLFQSKVPQCKHCNATVELDIQDFKWIFFKRVPPVIRLSSKTGFDTIQKRDLLIPTTAIPYDQQVRNPTSPYKFRPGLRPTRHANNMVTRNSSMIRSNNLQGMPLKLANRHIRCDRCDFLWEPPKETIETMQSYYRCESMQSYSRSTIRCPVCSFEMMFPVVEAQSMAKPLQSENFDRLSTIIPAGDNYIGSSTGGVMPGSKSDRCNTRSSSRIRNVPADRPIEDFRPLCTSPKNIMRPTLVRPNTNVGLNGINPGGILPF